MFSAEAWFVFTATHHAWDVFEPAERQGCCLKRAVQGRRHEQLHLLTLCVLAEQHFVQLRCLRGGRSNKGMAGTNALELSCSFYLRQLFRAASTGMRQITAAVAAWAKKHALGRLLDPWHTDHPTQRHGGRRHGLAPTWAIPRGVNFVSKKPGSSKPALPYGLFPRNSFISVTPWRTKVISLAPAAVFMALDWDGLLCVLWLIMLGAALQPCAERNRSSERHDWRNALRRIQTWGRGRRGRGL